MEWHDAAGVLPGKKHSASPHELGSYRHKHNNRAKSSVARPLPVQILGPLPPRSCCLHVEWAIGRRTAVEVRFDAILLKHFITALEG